MRKIIQLKPRKGSERSEKVDKGATKIIKLNAKKSIIDLYLEMRDPKNKM